MKKKRKMTAAAPAEPAKGDSHRGIAIGFRADSWRLIRALGAYAKSVRHSRNMAMVLLLEQSLAANGFPVDDFPNEPIEPE